MVEEQIIWVVEDDSEMRSLVSVALRQSGFVVEELENGRTLHEKIHRFGNGSKRPVLIVLDHHMPDIHGLDVWEKDAGYMGNTSVVVITAFGDHEIHARAERLGAVAVLDKPFDLRILQQIVKEHVSP